ncbi:hypothetical protein HBB16_13480 [Pseudonocardia sp. MCCB 268]|nr:hypothetical protein [Pseudonocardia cytotoxica]
MLRDAGIGGRGAWVPVRSLRARLAFPAARVAVEFDGWAAHRDRRTVPQTTGAAGNELVRGWTLLRVTWHDLRRRPGALAQIRHAPGSNGR